MKQRIGTLDQFINESKEILKHKHIDGLTIELLEPTSKGWKVKQTEIYDSWTDRKLRKPKSKIRFFSNKEIEELFKKE